MIDKDFEMLSLDNSSVIERTSVITWYDRNIKMFPEKGQILVHVNFSDDNTQFVESVRCDEIGLMDNQGSLYMYQSDVTHWAYFPKF